MGVLLTLIHTCRPTELAVGESFGAELASNLGVPATALHVLLALIHTCRATELAVGESFGAELTLCHPVHGSTTPRPRSGTRAKVASAEVAT